MAIRKRRRNKAEIERDRRRIADLYLHGWLHADIAKDIGVAQSTVSRDLVALHGEWKKSALLDFNEAKARELAKVDRLEREYWEAWERSKQGQKRTTVKGRGGSEDDEPTHKEKSVTLDEGTGDPRFLQGVQWCIDRRCKVLGVDAPQKLEHTGKDGGALRIVYVNDWRNSISDTPSGADSDQATPGAVPVAGSGPKVAQDDAGNADGG